VSLRFKEVGTLGFKGRSRTITLVKGLAMELRKEKDKDKT
jgi:hypothetical protein